MASKVSSSTLEGFLMHMRAGGASAEEAESASGERGDLLQALRSLSDALQLEELLRVDLREREGLSLLLHVVQESESPEVRDAALACLQCATFENVDNKFLLGEMGAVPMVVDILRMGEFVERGLGLLGNLCAGIRCNQDMVCEFGGIVPLVALFARGLQEDLPWLPSVMRTLKNVLCGHHANTALFVSESGPAVLEEALKREPLEEPLLTACLSLLATLLLVSPISCKEIMGKVEIFEKLEHGDQILECLESFAFKEVYGTFCRDRAVPNGFVFNDGSGPGVEIHCPINGPKIVSSNEVWTGTGTLRWVLRREQGNSSFLVGVVPDETCADNHALRVEGALAVKNSSTSYSNLPAVINVEVGSKIEVCIDGPENKVKFIQNGELKHTYTLSGQTNLRLCLVCWNNGRMRLLPEDFSD